MRLGPRRQLSRGFRGECTEPAAQQCPFALEERAVGIYGATYAGWVTPQTSAPASRASRRPGPASTPSSRGSCSRLMEQRRPSGCRQEWCVTAVCCAQFAPQGGGACGRECGQNTQRGYLLAFGPPLIQRLCLLEHCHHHVWSHDHFPCYSAISMGIQRLHTGTVCGDITATICFAGAASTWKG